MSQTRIAVIVFACLAGRGHASSAGFEGADATVPAAPRTATSVEVVPVVSRPLDTTVHLEGELSAWEVVAIYPRATGFVASITVDRASVVHRGQVLAHLVAPELAAQRTEADARTQGDQSTLDRLRAAARTPGVVAGHDVELAEAAVQVDRAHARALRDLEQYLVVTAPFDGVVTERNVHPGALVGPSTGGAGVPMLRVEQIARLRLTAAVPEGLAGQITEGTTAAFTVRAWPGRRFTGTIVRPSHTVDTRTRTMAVELDVDNADSAPGAGHVRGRRVARASRDAVAVRAAQRDRADDRAHLRRAGAGRCRRPGDRPARCGRGRPRRDHRGPLCG